MQAVLVCVRDILNEEIQDAKKSTYHVGEIAFLCSVLVFDQYCAH
jgi:hypothetical protein